MFTNASSSTSTSGSPLPPAAAPPVLERQLLCHWLFHHANWRHCLTDCGVDSDADSDRDCSRLQFASSPCAVVRALAQFHTHTHTCSRTQTAVHLLFSFFAFRFFLFVFFILSCCGFASIFCLWIFLVSR